VFVWSKELSDLFKHSNSSLPGNEDPFSLLRDVIEAEEIKLDRWTVVFRPLSEETTEGIDGKVMVSTTQATEDNAQVFVCQRL